MLFKFKSDHSKTKNGKKLKSVLIVISSFTAFMIVCGIFLLYGPFSYFRDLLITTSMETMHHQYIAHWFFSDSVINSVMSNNSVKPSTEPVDTSLISISASSASSSCAGPASSSNSSCVSRQQVKLTVNTLVNVSRNGFNAWLLEVPDPTKVHLAVTNQYGKSGQLLPDMVKSKGAIAGINGGGFVDPELKGPAAFSMGALFCGGRIYSGSQNTSYNIIGINKKHVLILESMTIAQMQAQGICDAVEFGPYLIRNGKPSAIYGNGGYGLNPRTVIGQKADGTFIFLVVDGRQIGSVGCDMKDLIAIMIKYGAVNAANLDGGGSTAMYFNGKVVNRPCANDGDGLRRINNAFVVMP